MSVLSEKQKKVMQPNFITKNSYICGQYIRKYIVCRFFVRLGGARIDTEKWRYLYSLRRDVWGLLTTNTFLLNGEIK